MEKDRSSRIIAIVALVVAVISLSVGFAAFSSSLTISSSATVSPNSDTFDIDFSASNASVTTTSIVPETSSASVAATNATIDNSSASPTITGISATFTEPGQYVTYTFYAANQGEYDGYLKSITYSNASGKDSFRVCTVTSDADDSLVQAACDDISVTVTVGDDISVTGSKADITGHVLSKGSFEKVTVTITYAADGDRADGDFSVAFGDISLSYSSVD